MGTIKRRGKAGQGGAASPSARLLNRILNTVLDIQVKVTEHDNKFDAVFGKLETHDRRFDGIDGKLREHDNRFEQADRRFDRIEEKLGVVDKTLEIIRLELKEDRTELKGHAGRIAVLEGR